VVLEILFVLPFVLHPALIPYTKVEESFTIQAIHDITTYGAFPEGGPSALKSHYDHFEFPGVVPRTFTGAVVLSGLQGAATWLQAVLNRPVKDRGIEAQIECRQLLGLINHYFLWRFSNSVGKSFGQGARTWFMVFLISQFHLMSYASRTLPNMFALGISMYDAGAEIWLLTQL
jgi:alpha-1,6-mannosyltransferase